MIDSIPPDERKRVFYVDSRTSYTVPYGTRAGETEVTVRTTGTAWDRETFPDYHELIQSLPPKAPPRVAPVKKGFRVPRTGKHRRGRGIN